MASLTSSNRTVWMARCIFPLLGERDDPAQVVVVPQNDPTYVYSRLTSGNTGMSIAVPDEADRRVAPADGQE